MSSLIFYWVKQSLSKGEKIIEQTLPEFDTNLLERNEQNF